MEDELLVAPFIAELALVLLSLLLLMSLVPCLGAGDAVHRGWVSSWELCACPGAAPRSRGWGGAQGMVVAAKTPKDTPNIAKPAARTRHLPGFGLGSPTCRGLLDAPAARPC